MTGKEIKSLTGIRGVAAIYVATFHFYQFYVLQPNANQDTFANNIFLKTFLSHGYISVDLFFILSAFVMSISSRKLFEDGFKATNYAFFMKKRWIRIYPAYFFIALYGYLIVEQGHRTPNFILSLTLLNLVFGASHILGHVWSLGAEWITYILYPVFLKICRYGKVAKWNYVVIGSALAGLYLLGALHYNNLLPPYMLDIYQGYPCLLRCFGSYLLGIAALGLYQQKKLTFITSHRGAVFISLLLFASLLFATMDIVTVLLFTLLIIAIANDHNIVSKLLGSKPVYFLGEISYPLYLINSLVFFKLNDLKMMAERIVGTTHSSIILYFVFMALNILLSYLFNLIIEKPIITALTNRVKSNRFPFNFKLPSISNN